MTLHEAATVFLIIGAVLLGPIRAHEVIGSRVPIGQDGCVVGVDCWEPMFVGTAETCARVMKEIGAQKVISWTGRPWDAKIDGYVLSGEPVLCIPSPSGLIR